jgi:hypothetical protein
MAIILMQGAVDGDWAHTHNFGVTIFGVDSRCFGGGVDAVACKIWSKGDTVFP